MRKSAALTMMFILAISVTAAFEYEGRTITPLKADQYTVDKNGKEQMVGTIYVGDEGVRSETVLNPEDGQQMITIFRVGENIQYFINPQTKKYYQTNIKPEDLEKWVGSDVQVEKKDALGTETVQGYTCDIQKVTTTVKIMGFTKTVKSTQYIARELNLPIKTVNEDGSTMEYRNIDEGKQPSNLFVLPEGLTKAGSMMGVFMGGGETGESGGGDESGSGDSEGGGSEGGGSDQKAPSAADVLKGIFG